MLEARLIATTLVATLVACGPMNTPSPRTPGPSTMPTDPKPSDHGPPHGSHDHPGAHAHAHDGHHAFTDADAWTGVFDDPSRDAWQRPDEVVRALDLAPTMVVADIGAGTGYFAVRLARAVPQGAVIATDIEPDMVRFLGERARREGLENLRATLAPAQGTSGLAAASVDRVLVVNVWHHLHDRVDFARDLAAALRPGGKIFVVDFSLTAERGPPARMRLAPEALVAELDAAGLSATVSPIALPDQYIVEARRRPAPKQDR